MKSLFFLFIILLLTGCNSKKDEDAAGNDVVIPLPSAPKDLAYPQSTLILSKNQAMSGIIPTYKVSTTVIFRSSPQMPEGIVLNQDTGLIAGVPLNSQADRVYLISVLNLIGYTLGGIPITQSEASTFSLTIRVKDVPPSNLQYPNPSYSLQIGQDFTVITPTISGGVVLSYAITPVLPSGLTLDTETGQIYGRPLVSSTSKIYSIVATNSGGTSTFNLNLEVKGDAPYNLSYVYNNQTYRSGINIASNLPIYSGETATTFSTNPVLPEGMSINSQTGVISGNPGEVVFNKNYVVTASNLWGNSTFNLKMTVNPNILDLATGEEHSCVIKNKKVYCFGQNEWGQVGKLSTELSCFDTQSQPVKCEINIVKVKYQNIDLLAKKLALGSDFSCALSYEGKVYCWGLNNEGQLGSGSILTSSHLPQIVVTESAELTNIVDISAGDSHICALNNIGKLYCWGNNANNKLYNILLPRTSIATQVILPFDVSSMSVGFNHNCASMNSSVYCWGGLNLNLLGDFPEEQESNLVRVKKSNGEFLELAQQLIAGESYSVASVNNSILFWGQNEIDGSASTGDFLIKPRAVNSYLDEDALLNNISYLAKGKNSWCFVKNESGYCVGQNDSNFGNETNINQPNFYPIPILDPSGVSPMPNVEKISQGFSSHRCIANTLAQVYCFGQNGSGQLGLGNTTAELRLPNIVLIEN